MSGERIDVGQPPLPDTLSVLPRALSEIADSNLAARDFVKKTEEDFWNEISALHTKVRSGYTTGLTGVDFALSEGDMHYLKRAGKDNPTEALMYISHSQELVDTVSDRKGEPITWGRYLHHPVKTLRNKEKFILAERTYNIAFAVIDAEEPELEIDGTSMFLTLRIEPPTWIDSGPQRTEPLMHSRDGDSHRIILSHRNVSDMLINPSRNEYDRYNSQPRPSMLHFIASGEQATDISDYISTISARK